MKETKVSSSVVSARQSVSRGSVMLAAKTEKRILT
jgi:hypothetical protein